MKGVENFRFDAEGGDAASGPRSAAIPGAAFHRLPGLQGLLQVGLVRLSGCGCGCGCLGLVSGLQTVSYMRPSGDWLSLTIDTYKIKVYSKHIFNQPYNTGEYKWTRLDC